MPLIARVPPAHTVGEFRRAARLRFAEANRAAERGDRLVGVYLAGYAAEMILKAAYFRIVGERASDPIPLSELQGIKKQVKLSLGIVWSGNLHNLPQWVELLVEECKLRGKPCTLGFASRVTDQIRRIYANWREDIRNRANRPRSGEWDQVFRAVEWLFASETRLVG